MMPHLLDRPLPCLELHHTKGRSLQNDAEIIGDERQLVNPQTWAPQYTGRSATALPRLIGGTGLNSQTANSSS